MAFLLVVLARAERHAGVEREDDLTRLRRGHRLPGRMRVDARRDTLRPEMTAVGELPVLVRHLRVFERNVRADDRERRGKAALRLGNLLVLGEIELDLRPRLLDVVV